MTLSDWLDLIQAASIIIASGVAVRGINTWKREFIGKRKMELAEEVLALFYEAKDTIGYIRSPHGHAGEGSTRNGDPTETEEEKHSLDLAFVAIERYNKNSEIFSRLHALRYRFMAQVGKEKIEPFLELAGVINEIILASRQLAREWDPRSQGLMTPEKRKKQRERIQRAEAIFWQAYDDKDPIQLKVDSLVQNIERICQPILTGSK